MSLLAWLFGRPALPEQIDAAALIRVLKLQGWEPTFKRPAHRP